MGIESLWLHTSRLLTVKPPQRLDRRGVERGFSTASAGQCNRWASTSVGDQTKTSMAAGPAQRWLGFPGCFAADSLGLVQVLGAFSPCVIALVALAAHARFDASLGRSLAVLEWVKKAEMDSGQRAAMGHT